MSFDRILVVDWSAASSPSPAKPSADAIWIATAEVGTGTVTTAYHRTRDAAETTLKAAITAALNAGERLLIGFDFPFGYPAGFAAQICGARDPLALWDWLTSHIEDAADNTNNRFRLAAEINAGLPGIGPFWGRPRNLKLPDLPEKGTARHGHPFAERRAVEALVTSAQPVWKLYTTGSVGSQSLLGLPVLSRLRRTYPAQIAAWPFEPWAEAPVVLAEVYPSLLAQQVKAAITDGAIKDEVQVRLLSTALARLARDEMLAPLFAPDAPDKVLAEEGWILGAGHEAALAAALRAPLIPPRLRDDCFAMPQGVTWVPVDDALDRLQSALRPITGTETLPLAQADARVLAAPAMARRSNPPRANAAVDGYGFAHAATGAGVQRLPLIDGRAAAGQPHAGAVPHGQAIRILTGAILPEGVDTVVLEEDCATDGGTVAFDGPVKPNANTRRAGEDVAEGAQALPAGHRLRAPDLALLSALGVAEVSAYRPLRVGVLSTGDEIVGNPASPAAPHQIYDANRPMLLALAKAWGYVPVDLGHAPDRPARIAAKLGQGARKADVILTSGGASAGDEDHVSKLLSERGTLFSWRIAVKPGRPLALAMWEGTPVFGLPGNPVAAMVCALIFARPAFSLMAGAGWAQPLAFTVPAAFSKTKKAGRREYLRARLNAEGAADVFASEGSGRISGLSWATGLVELPDGALTVTPGTPVRFLPYEGFGVA